MRYRLAIRYRTTVAVRLFFIAVIVRRYRSTGDALFLLILSVVAHGVLLTPAGLVTDWRCGRSRQSRDQSQA